jgi:hypothetical protein
MDTDIIVSLVSAATAVVLAVYTYYTRKSQDKSIEILKNQLQEKLSEKDALRDYQYEARKRLYSEYEPIFFQFIEQSESALSRIENLARTSRENHLGEGGWLFEKYYFASTLYRLFAPLASYKLVLDKLTLFDFNLDSRIYFQFNLMKILVHTFNDDFEIAQCGNFDYEPYAKDWQKARIKNEQKYWRQGIPAGRLEKSIDALIIMDNTKKKVMSFGEFEHKYYTDKDFPNEFDVAGDIFFNFQPDKRPILWTILIVQAHLYQLFNRIGNEKQLDKEALIKSLYKFPNGDDGRYFWNAGGADEFEKILKIAQTYLNRKIQRYLG